MPLKSFAKIATTPVDGQEEQMDENVTNEVEVDNEENGFDTASRFEEANADWL